MAKISEKKNLIIKKFIKQCTKLNRLPTVDEFQKETGVTKDMVKHHYGNITKLFEAAQVANPQAFKNSLHNVFNIKNVNKIKKEVKNFQRFIITSAVTGCKVNQDFMACIDTYCKVKDAKLLVLISSDPAAKVTYNGFIDPLIPHESVVAANMSLNSNLHLSTIRLSAKQIEPITGLSRLGQRNGSFIFASPKQRLKLIPVANSKYPHAIMTTGAITNPDYSTDRYMSERTAYIGLHDHILGAIIVEVVNNIEFHFRQVQFVGDSFVDLGEEFKTDGTLNKVDAMAVVLGDIHVGETDLTAIKAWKEVINLLNPKYILLHDIFNGRSINPHTSDNIVERSQSINDGISLCNETQAVATFLEDLSIFNSELVVVKSNHDTWLNTYLSKALYASDPQNHGFALKLADAFVNNKQDPLQYAVELHCPDLKNHIKWLQIDEDFKVAGCQLAAHGHIGSNGAKGNIVSMENSYGDSITGHSHSPQILRHAMSVGTSTFLRLSYNKGASSWLQSSAILYKNGNKQLINSFEGKWRLEE